MVAGSRRDSSYWNATWTVDASIDRPVRLTIAKRLFRKFEKIGSLERCLYFMCAMYALPTSVQAQSKMRQLIDDYVASQGKPLDQAEISDEFIHKLRLAAADGVFLDRQNISHKSPKVMVPPDGLEDALDGLVARFGESAVITALQTRKRKGRLVAVTDGLQERGGRGRKSRIDFARLFEMARQMEQDRNLSRWNAARRVAGSIRDSRAWNATWTVVEIVGEDSPRHSIAKRLDRKFKNDEKRYRCLYLEVVASILDQTREKVHRIVSDYKASKGKEVLMEADICHEYVQRLRLAVAETPAGRSFLDVGESISHNSPN